jgi:hypothetical protein
MSELACLPEQASERSILISSFSFVFFAHPVTQHRHRHQHHHQRQKTRPLTTSISTKKRTPSGMENQWRAGGMAMGIYFSFLFSFGFNFLGAAPTIGKEIPTSCPTAAAGK